MVLDYSVLGLQYYYVYNVLEQCGTTHILSTMATLLRSFHNGLVNQLCGQKLDFLALRVQVPRPLYY
jgi:hypothetical protein